MFSEPSSRLGSDLQEEAVTWVVRLTSGECSSATLIEYRTWLNRSPEHAKALEDARQLWLGLGLALTESVTSSLSDHTIQKHPVHRPWLPVLKMVASVLLAVFVSVIFNRFQYDQSTGTGQFQTVELADGSTVQLDTNTALNVDFNGQQRHINLAYGQAYFDVTSNPHRPFTIDAGFGRIRVVGTAFSVRREHGNVWVTVTRGKVQVSSAAIERPMFLTENQQVVFSDTDRAPTVNLVDTEQALSWRSGRLQFEHQPLAQVLRELQRYDQRYWLFDEKIAKQMNVSTSIYLDNIDEWLEGLQHTLSIKVVHMGPIVWLKAEPTFSPSINARAASPG